MLTNTQNENKSIYDLIFGNLYITLLFLLALMVVSALVNRKNHAYYNFKDDEAAQRHRLNLKYQLNQRENVDLDRVNSIIAWYNIGAISISCLIGAALYFFGQSYNFSLSVAGVCFIVLAVVSHFAACSQIGKIYGNNKLRD
ncbi:MAG: hypothetical protein IJM15_00200 [Erysipelotrichaceae bacterium]|nr:hypothetical protein [Erysipelotrichaceae bacterium]